MWTILVTLYAVALSALWGLLTYKAAKIQGDSRAVLLGALSAVFAVPALIYKVFLDKSNKTE